jgi:hypothetical protein
MGWQEKHLIFKSDEEAIDAVLRPILRFTRRAVSPRALLVPLLFSFSLWTFGGGKALSIALLAYLLTITEVYKEAVLFVATLAFAISSLKWLGLWEYLPTVALN